MLRRIPLLLIVVLCSFHLQAQEFKPFKVDLGLSFNTPTDDQAGNGMGGYIEPRYGLDDYITLGLRLEWSALSSGNITINTQNVDLSAASVRNTMFVGEYFFNKEKVRPFVGMGIGMYRRQSHGISITAGSVQIGDLNRSVSNFGFAPRVGVNAGHFRLSTIFNFTGNDISNYFGINVGIEIGGGRQGSL